MSPKKNVIKDDATKTVMRRRSAKGRAEAEVDDAQTRKMQSNMKTQLNNAQKRLDAHGRVRPPASPSGGTAEHS